MEPAPLKKQYTAEEVRTAMIIWESMATALNDPLDSKHNAVRADQRAGGMAGLRDVALRLVGPVEVAYKKINADNAFDAPFDAEFVPAVLSLIALTHQTLQVDGKAVMAAAVKAFDVGPETGSQPGMVR